MLPRKALAPVLLVVAGCSDDAAPPERAQRNRKEFTYEAVAANRELEIPDGFRGEVHPLLRAEARLELRTRWTPTLSEAKRSGIKLGVIDNASAPEYSIPADVVALLTETTAAKERATYGARELSVFLPDEVTGVGQTWKIDPARAAAFLEQFHPRTAVTFDRYHQPYGRRPGPPGAFGILRATSARYLDILFRVHAEFVLAEGVALYTPACFLGRMLVDREHGTVAWLEMHVPTDRPVNLNITLTFPLPDQPRKEVTNIVFEHVDPMELAGGDGELLAGIEWDEALQLDVAHDQLKRAFYRFMAIEWVPVERMLAAAQAANKPILTVVLTSPLDDQSC